MPSEEADPTTITTSDEPEATLRPNRRAFLILIATIVVGLSVNTLIGLMRDNYVYSESQEQREETSAKIAENQPKSTPEPQGDPRVRSTVNLIDSINPLAGYAIIAFGVYYFIMDLVRSMQGMTIQEKTASLTSLIQVIFSWPTALLIIILLIHGEIPDMAKRITSIGPSGIILEEKVDVLETSQAILGTSQAMLATSQSGLAISQTHMAATQVNLSGEVQRIRQELRCGSSALRTPMPTSEPEASPQAGLTPDQDASLRQSLVDFNDYLRAIGFPLSATDPTTIGIGILSDFPQSAWYEPGDDIICIGSEMVKNVMDNSQLLRRLYTHHALNSASRGNTIIQYGLSFYYPASFRDNSKVGDYDLKDVRMITVATPRPGFEGELGLAWGSVFWGLRDELGGERADRLLFDAWKTSTIRNPTDFAARVLGLLTAEGETSDADNIRQLFEQRGISVAN